MTPTPRDRAWLWWCVAAASVLSLYASVPYVREMQVLLRSQLQDYFDIIFRATIALLGAALLISGVWLELKRARSNRAAADRQFSVVRLVLKKAAQVAICVALYYFGLSEAIATNPAQGVRIIEFVHLFQFTLVTLLVLKAVATSIKGRASYIVAFLVMCLVGLGDEAIQGYIARRVGELRDVQINAIVAALALLAVWLIFSPRVLSARSAHDHKALVLSLMGLAVIGSAAFILSFHIGYRIEDARCGVFYSLYPKEELLNRSKNARLGPRLPPGGSLASARIRGFWAPEDFYETEAFRHLAERDKLERQVRHWEAFCEERIRRIYYAPFADLGEWAGWTAERMRKEFGDYNISHFVSYHYDLVFRGWRRWHVLAVSFAACTVLLVLGIVSKWQRG
ncbi:MAG TPA: VanZ family protein [bacterium]|nr:VanZ family protein [bacterium]